MDVERIQKVNNLALDLMKQGLASDRDEAIAKAEHIFKDRDTEDYAELRKTMNGDTSEEQNKEQQQITNSSDLTQDQIKEILEEKEDNLINTYYPKFKSHEFDFLVEKNLFKLNFSRYGLIEIKDASQNQALETIRTTLLLLKDLKKCKKKWNILNVKFHILRTNQYKGEQPLLRV